MGIVLFQLGAALLWKWMLNLTAPQPLWVHLLGSSHTPVHTDTFLTLSPLELPLSGGYAPLELPQSLGGWAFTPITQGQQATATLFTWTFTVATSVYGYWVNDDNDGIAVFGERFSVAYVFPSGGGTFSFKLPPTLISEN